MIIKTIATRKTIMHRLFGERFAPRLQLGLCDIERRMIDKRRRLRNCCTAILFIGLIGTLLNSLTR